MPPITNDATVSARAQMQMRPWMCTLAPSLSVACSGRPHVSLESRTRTLRFPNGRYDLRGLQGASTLDQQQVDAHPEIQFTLDSTVCHAMDVDAGECTSSRVIEASENGGSIGLTVARWLASAGLNLDSPNELTAADRMGRLGEDGQMRRPPLRLTGIMLTILISYEAAWREPSQAPARMPISNAHMRCSYLFLSL